MFHSPLRPALLVVANTQKVNVNEVLEKESGFKMWGALYHIPTGKYLECLAKFKVLLQFINLLMKIALFSQVIFQNFHLFLIEGDVGEYL